MIWYRNKCTHT